MAEEILEETVNGTPVVVQSETAADISGEGLAFTVNEAFILVSVMVVVVVMLFQDGIVVLTFFLVLSVMILQVILGLMFPV